MDVWLVVVWCSLALGWFLYRKVAKNARFFERHGIPYDKPLPLLGNTLRLMMQKETMMEALLRPYEKFKNDMVFGWFPMGVPNFVIADPAVVRQITIRDFDSFVNHDKSYDADMDAFSSKMLFTLTDEQWRHMRSALSPIFTSSKMRMMFGVLTECASEFVEARKGEERVIVNCGEAYPRYTVDGIATAVLGFTGDCIRNESSKLFAFAKCMQKPTFGMSLKVLVYLLSRWIYVRLRLQLTRAEVRDFFYDAIVRVMREREERNHFRPDVVQLLLQLKRGTLQRESELDESELTNFAANHEYDAGARDKSTACWTEEHFMAQGYLFFLAGFETTNTLLQVTSFCLARNRVVQDELIREVDAVAQTLDGGPISYEALHKMRYLDMVVSEALRFWPPTILTMRQCNKRCELKLSNGRTVTVEEGDMCLLPIVALHHDERFFTDPGRFDPLRFSEKRRSSLVPGSYIPFGSGPRVCIGSRFALMEAKLLLFYVLRKFTIEACELTPEKLEMKLGMMENSLKQEIIVEYRPRKKTM